MGHRMGKMAALSWNGAMAEFVDDCSAGPG